MDDKEGPSLSIMCREGLLSIAPGYCVHCGRDSFDENTSQAGFYGKQCCELKMPAGNLPKAKSQKMFKIFAVVDHRLTFPGIEDFIEFSSTLLQMTDIRIYCRRVH